MHANKGEQFSVSVSSSCCTRFKAEFICDSIENAFVCSVGFQRGPNKARARAADLVSYPHKSKSPTNYSLAPRLRGERVGVRCSRRINDRDPSPPSPLPSKTRGEGGSPT